MKTVKILVELTVDVNSDVEAKNWLEDVVLKNFSEVGEKVHSIELVNKDQDQK